MKGLGETIYKQGIREGLRQVREERRKAEYEQGIEALILDNLERGTANERILLKLQKYFDLSEERAKMYLKRFALNEN